MAAVKCSLNRPISPKTQLEQEKRIRREIANSNERRRMQSINAGFQSLRTLLPHHDGEKLSKVRPLIMCLLCVVLPACLQSHYAQRCDDSLARPTHRPLLATDRCDRNYCEFANGWPCRAHCHVLLYWHGDMVAVWLHRHS